MRGRSSPTQPGEKSASLRPDSDRMSSAAGWSTMRATLPRPGDGSGPVQARLEDPLRGGGMSVELSSRSNGAALEVAAAVRARTTQAHLEAARAPRALEGADHRLRRLRQQIDVAALAVGAQLQHAASLPAIVGPCSWQGRTSVRRVKMGRPLRMGDEDEATDPVPDRGTPGYREDHCCPAHR